MRFKNLRQMLDAHQQLVLLRLEEVEAAKRVVDASAERRG
jgi:hypothetical protein